jgi:hypothetical protein
MGMAFRVVLSALAVGSLAVASGGCETTAQRSAELEKRARHEQLAVRGVSVVRENPSVRVLESTLLRGSGGGAVVVVLRNTSARAIVGAPIEITVRGGSGGVLFRNDQPGLEAGLTRVASLAGRGTGVWVDDQVQLPGGKPTPASASAVVGSGRVARGGVPRITVGGVHLSGEGAEAGASGVVANHSGVAQQNLVVYAVARRGGRVVAAGRAVLPEVPAGGGVPFQAFFVGDPAGAKLEASAPATTF